MKELTYFKNSGKMPRIKEGDLIASFRSDSIKDAAFSELKAGSDILFQFPSVSKKESERRAQQNNYDYFINTMADMVQKYAPLMEDQSNERHLQQ